MRSVNKVFLSSEVVNGAAARGARTGAIARPLRRRRAGFGGARGDTCSRFSQKQHVGARTGVIARPFAGDVQGLGGARGALSKDTRLMS